MRFWGTRGTLELSLDGMEHSILVPELNTGYRKTPSNERVTVSYSVFWQGDDLIVATKRPVSSPGWGPGHIWTKQILSLKPSGFLVIT
jgi:hypothetical protein